MKVIQQLIYLALAGGLFLYSQEINDLERISSTAASYYNEGNYNNAIIFYEDLLAKQEQKYGYENIAVAGTLTKLGELYKRLGMIEIADYYFQEAIIITTQNNNSYITISFNIFLN